MPAAFLKCPLRTIWVPGTLHVGERKERKRRGKRNKKGKEREKGFGKFAAYGGRGDDCK
jgi:hypothetical protein